MSTTVAIIGAAGKMGGRILNNLLKCDQYERLLCEKSPSGIEALQQRGLSVIDSPEGVGRADISIFAVPDAMMRKVSDELVPHAKAGSTIILLDPAAAAAEELALREDLDYVVSHPCHPPLFGDQPTEEARKDFFGGIAAIQDIVIALLQGSEEAFEQANTLCKAMFAPVKTAHRITVEQMAILEPAMAEVVAASAAVLMKQAMDEAIKAGVPEAAARSFMMGHAQIPLAIVFGAIESPFSDAAKIAIKCGQEMIYKENWRDVFQPDKVKAVIHRMLHPEDEK